MSMIEVLETLRDAEKADKPEEASVFTAVGDNVIWSGVQFDWEEEKVKCVPFVRVYRYEDMVRAIDTARITVMADLWPDHRGPGSGFYNALLWELGSIEDLVKEQTL